MYVKEGRTDGWDQRIVLKKENFGGGACLDIGKVVRLGHRILRLGFGGIGHSPSGRRGV
jgi:hypothetical protein